ncbi:hypothetical protein [Psychromonas aquimarina]|uniref:hypothetical protein n=1 Tax=Psychromonas aquimarina TaxID=444919 RepID=UPI00048D9668|nr:hypothetical protein [Psychromonas aquimarina]
MKVLKCLGISFGVIIGGIFVALAILGSFVPETSVYLGRQVPSKYMEEINTLGLVADDEQIKYFYTDALFDIKEGMYFITDKNLVLYSNMWEEPKTIISFSDISSIEVDYDDSFLNDSMVLVGVLDYEIEFPLSSEHARDRKFIEYLLTKTQIE